MSSIPLSQEHGINPAVTTCPRCGGPGEGLVLAGNSITWKCNDCGQNHIAYAGKAGRMKCPCGNKASYGGGGFTKIGKFDGNRDKVLDSDICSNCKKELEEHKAIVAAGGVFWQCSTCNSSGVIKKSEFADAVREANKVAAPEPCGIDFEGTTNCPVCNQQGEFCREED